MVISNHMDKISLKGISANRTKYRLLSVFWFMPAFIFFCSSAWCASDSAYITEETTVIATVNGFPLTVREYEWYIKESRSEVISTFLHSNELKGISSDFWETEFNGTKPVDVLREIALKRAIHEKIHLVYMYERGVIESPDYMNFLDVYHDYCSNENLPDKEKIVFGPIRFSERDYYNYWYSNRLIDLKTKVFTETKKSNSRDTGKDTTAHNTDREIEYLFTEKITLYESRAEININYQLIKNLNPLF